MKEYLGCLTGKYGDTVMLAYGGGSIRRNGIYDEVTGVLTAAGVEALADFIREIGLPTTLRELGVDETVDLKMIADSCNLSPGSYKKMTHEEVYQIFTEAR